MQVSPKGDLVLAKVAETEEKTTGGILLPSSAQRKPTSGSSDTSCAADLVSGEKLLNINHLVGDVVALGDGKVGPLTRDFTLAVGNTILYNKFGLGATDIEVQGIEHILIKEDDCIGTLPRTGATAADIVDLQPLGDRVLLKVCLEASCSPGRPALSANQCGLSIDMHSLVLISG